MSDEIVIRPNDRVIRGVVTCIVMAWWVEGAVVLVREGSPLSAVIVVWVLLYLPFIWFLAWLTVGRWAFAVSNGDLVIHRRLATVELWKTPYPIATIHGFRVEEQRRRIKGALSVRYRVLMEGVNGVREVAWFRAMSDAETLAGQLQSLTRFGGVQ